MRRSVSWAAPLLILTLGLALRAVDPQFIEQRRLLVFDAYQHVFRPAPMDGGVRIIDIDDESLRRLGQWPWPRTIMAELVTRLAAQGPAAIALDIVFAEPDRTSPRQVIPLWAALGGNAELAALAAALPDHDARLTGALRQAPAVVGVVLNHSPGGAAIAARWGLAEAGDDPRQFLPLFHNAVTNLPEIDAAAAGIGCLNVDVDGDGVVRRLPLLAALAGPAGGRFQVVPSLVAEAVRVGVGASTYIVRSSGASGQTAFGGRTGINHLRIGPLDVPTDRRGRIWLRDAGPMPERLIPAWRVMAGQVSREDIGDRIVFVGTTAAGLTDRRATPLNPVTAGVEIHARLVEQILLHDYLERPDWMTGAEMLFLLVCGLTLMMVLPRSGPAWGTAIAGLWIVAALANSALSFVRFGWLVDPVYPSIVIAALSLVQSLIAFQSREAERRRVRDAFSRYMSPALVEVLARDPSRLRLGGEVRDMTVLFSDIRGFTTRSESMTAEELTRFLNAFLTPMTEIVLDHRGTVDKYMGDAIMAFWNAPLDDPDHAMHAAEAALAMIAALGRLNAGWQAEAAAAGRGFVAVAIGIGINSGPCCVGNMGSVQRFDYSVIGDDVNLASRLEGQCKTYGVPIVLGEKTRLRLGAQALLELDRVRVKGKAVAERIFTLVGDAAVAATPAFSAWREAHDGMLVAYRERNWSVAETLLARCHGMADPACRGLYDLYARRIAAFRDAPPPEDWDGVARATEK